MFILLLIISYQVNIYKTSGALKIIKPALILFLLLIKTKGNKKGWNKFNIVSTFISAWQRPTLAGGDPPTTLGVQKLNDCVRHGNRCILLAIATTLFSWKNFVLSKLANINFLPSNTISTWLSPRPISIGPLRASLHFHFQPIYLIISQGSYFHIGMGNLILRRVSHLDAFSVYLIHT